MQPHTHPPLREELHTSSEIVCDTFTIRIDLLFADNFTLTLYYDDHKRHHVCLFCDMPRTSPGNKPGLGNVSRIKLLLSLMKSTDHLSLLTFNLNPDRADIQAAVAKTSG